MAILALKTHTFVFFLLFLELGRRGLRRTGPELSVLAKNDLELLTPDVLDKAQFMQCWGWNRALYVPGEHLPSSHTPFVDAASTAHSCPVHSWTSACAGLHSSC